MSGFQHVLADIGNVCIWGASAALVLFIIQYTVLAAWWRDAIGITIVGLDVCLLAIFVPSLIALADPGMSNFARTTWYFYLSAAVVIATFGFVMTRLITWDVIRRQRQHVLPGRRGDASRHADPREP